MHGTETSNAPLRPLATHLQAYNSHRHILLVSQSGVVVTGWSMAGTQPKTGSSHKCSSIVLTFLLQVNVYLMERART